MHLIVAKKCLIFILFCHQGKNVSSEHIKGIQRGYYLILCGWYFIKCIK